MDLFDSKHAKMSIFSKITVLSNEVGAVNLAQGFPDFDGPQEIKDAAIKAILEGRNQYAPAIGIEPLRSKIVGRVFDTHGLSFDHHLETTVFSGATEALFCALGGLFRPGDEVLTFDPHYESYKGTCDIFGIKLVGLPLRPPKWSIDFEKLQGMINSSTKGLILNTPHNPTGKVFSTEELEQVAKLAQNHNLLVISDEVYEEIVFDQGVHKSIAMTQGMRERTVVISSTAKTYSFTGWKVGYALAPEELTSKLRFLHQNAVFCGATPLQWGMLKAFELDEKYYLDLKTHYETRRNFICKNLAEVGFKVLAPQGAYFIMADYSELSNQGDLEFCLKLLREAKVASIPVSGFIQDKAEAAKFSFLRFGFCKNLETLEAAHERLKKYFG